MPDVQTPAEIRWLVDLVGEDGALRLMESAGGTRMHIPARVRPGSPIAKLVGASPAQHLADHLGTGNWLVPAAKRWRAQIYHARGMTLREIALKVGLNERTAGRYVSGEPRDRQMELALRP